MCFFLGIYCYITVLERADNHDLIISARRDSGKRSINLKAYSMS